MRKKLSSCLPGGGWNIMLPHYLYLNSTERQSAQKQIIAVLF
jgi:hypothetical protein